MLKTFNGIIYISLDYSAMSNELAKHLLNLQK